MKLPTTPCPVGGKVPWQNGIWPIVSRKEHPVLRWLYCIHQKHNGLIIWANVSQEDIVRNMNEVALFKVHQTVYLGPFQQRTILQRKWDFERGCFVYFLEGNRPGREFAFSEAQLVEKVKAVEEG